MPSVPIITEPVTQTTTPAELVVISEVVTVVVPVKSSKPGMVCRVKVMDWPLMLSVISEGPDVSNASRSEDMGGVKLPVAEADDFGRGVMVGIDRKDDVVRDVAAKAMRMLVVVLGKPSVGGADGALVAGSWLPREVEMLLINDDKREELLGFDSSCGLLEF